MRIDLPKKKIKRGFNLDQIRLFIYGLEGIGKSTFASRFRDSLFVLTEQGANALEVAPILIPDWPTFLAVVDKILDGDHDYKNIVFDTIDNIPKLCVEHFCKKYKINHQSDLKWGKGWDLARREFEEPMLRLSLSKYGLIFISHATEKEVVKKHAKYPKMTCTLAKQGREVILPFVDIIGYCSIEEYDKKERRCITFEPSEYAEAKDRTGLLPSIMPLNYTKFKRCFEDQNIKPEED